MNDTAARLRKQAEEMRFGWPMLAQDMLESADQLERFQWHALTDRAPDRGQMIFCTDGEHRWVDKFCPGVALEWYGIGSGRCQATHWCAVPELPNKKTAPHF